MSSTKVDAKDADQTFTIAEHNPAARTQGEFISIKADSRDIGVGQEVVDRLGLEHGDRFVVAFDEENRPWVGFVSAEKLEDPVSVGPQLYVYDTGCRVQSKGVVQTFRRFAAKERRRLWFLPDTAEVEVQGVGVTLHRLSLHEVEGGADE